MLSCFQVVVWLRLGGWNSVLAQNVAWGLVGQRTPRVGPAPLSGRIASRNSRVLSELPDSRAPVDESSHGPVLLGAVELVSDEPAVPREKGIGFSDIGHFLERFPQPSAGVVLSLSLIRNPGRRCSYSTQFPAASYSFCSS